MEWKYWHLIKGNNINVAYHYPTLELIVMNDVTYQVINALIDGMSLEKICTEFQMSENILVSFIQTLEKTIFDKRNIKNEGDKKDRSLHRITLHVSNDCNLRCKYCYAGGGNYKQKRSFMSEDTAAAFVEFCIKNFDKIERIAFFGGEPLMNVDIMEYVCKQFKTYYLEGKSSFVPQFGVITNGTILTSKILSFLKENISHITVSIDGPKEVNDANRIYKNGKGSYEKVYEFIHAVRRETNIPVCFEATFTQSHIKAHYENKDIVDFLLNEFGIKGSIVNERNLPAKYMLDYWKCLDYSNLIQTEFENMPEGFWGVLDAVVNKSNREICPIIEDIFAVGVDGAIYPCHMLSGKINNSLGNIKGEHVFNTLSLYESCHSLIKLRQNEVCQKCWGQNLCSGCAVSKFYNERKEKFDLEPKTELCKLTLQHLEQILLMIATIRTTPLLWDTLLTKASQH